VTLGVHDATDAQDEVGGGISDRPEDMVDVYHTFFGIAGLSLMGYPGLEPIDPTFALPLAVVERLHRQRGGRGAGGAAAAVEAAAEGPADGATGAALAEADV
jgi:hypothetical protein